MKKIFLLALFLTPILGSAQFIDDNYFFTSLELDPKNLILGSDVNDPALNSRITIGYRGGHFQTQVFYESFKEIGYESVQFQAGRAFNTTMPLQIVALAGVGIIKRQVSWMPQVYHVSASVEGNVEYHITNWLAVKTALELKMRGDLDKFIASGFIGIIIKLSNN